MHRTDWTNGAIEEILQNGALKQKIYREILCMCVCVCVRERKCVFVCVCANEETKCNLGAKDWDVLRIDDDDDDDDMENWKGVNEKWQFVEESLIIMMIQISL